MSESEVIFSTLSRAKRRRRWVLGLLGLWWGIFATAVCWLLALLVFKLFPVPWTTIEAIGLGCLLFIPLGFLVGWWPRHTLLQTARWVDREAGFKDRLSTAVELHPRPDDNPWRPLVLNDAAQHAADFQPRSILPLVLPRIARWTLLLLLLGFGLGFIPEYRSKKQVERAQDAVVIQEVGRSLEALVRRELANHQPVLEPTASGLKEVQELGKTLAQSRLTRTEALRDLTSVTDRLKEQANELNKQTALKKMARAARNPSAAPSETKSDLLKQMEALKQKLGDASADPNDLDKLQQKLQKIQQAAAGMSETGADDAQRERLTDALSQLGQDAADLGLDLPNIDAAMQALAGAQIDKFLKELDLATLDLQRLEQMAKAMQNLELKLAEAGKDLAEQLDKAQALPALASLNRMMKELNRNDLSEEELRKLMEEIEKAIKPGSEYGKVGDHLKDALAQCNSGNCQGASAALGEAAKELQRLMQQAGDLEAMLAALEGLGNAGFCIGNGNGWGQGLRKGPGKFGEGGPPGSGVGTWADENLWLNEELNTGRWDNSGIVQPDMEARGESDRGEGALTENLQKTRVKGQISPGSKSMPSMTLRGVSIRGISKVSYQEAVASAQSDAQSALDQERVPRAYQGAVRDYFDDLKDE